MRLQGPIELLTGFGICAVHQGFGESTVNFCELNIFLLHQEIGGYILRVGFGKRGVVGIGNILSLILLKQYFETFSEYGYLFEISLW